MPDPGSASRDEREAAIRAWEEQTHSSLVASGRKKKLSGIAFAAVAAVVLGAVWYWKHDGSDPERSGQAGLSIPERKPVPKLKEQPVESAPALLASSAQQSNDPLQAQREQMALQRLEQERRMLEARMKSAIVAPHTSGHGSGALPSPEGEGEQVRVSSGLPNASGSERGAQDPNSRFARAVSGTGISVSSAHRIDNLPYKVLQGKLIEAVLEPRATSDLPGMVCALVQRDVYGAQGRNPLIPWGSRICGVYSAELRKGQDRLFVIWNTLRRPDGVQVTLDSAGADQLGTAGMGGIVNTHFAQIFGMSALLSIVGAGASTVGVGSGDQFNSASAYRQSVQQAAAQSSQSVLQPYIGIPSTITVPAGSRVRIYANRDLDFTPIYQDEIEAVQREHGVRFIE